MVIQQPLSDVYLVASDTMCLFDALNALDRITVSGISRDNWYLPAAVKAMDSGAMVYGGKYNAPDYELLLGKGVRLAIESTMINHTPSVREKLIELGIPVFTEMSSYESEPLGRTEWVKCYGAMLDKEDEAKALFDEQVAESRASTAPMTGKTVAFFYINSNGSAIVRKPGDYVTKMIDQAGGDYIFSSLDEGEGSHVERHAGDGTLLRHGQGCRHHHLQRVDRRQRGQRRRACAQKRAARRLQGREERQRVGDRPEHVPADDADGPHHRRLQRRDNRVVRR